MHAPLKVDRSGSASLTQATQGDVEALAQSLALFVLPGDTIWLSGTLGSGKSTFARALIRAIADDDELDVPSPTFPIVQPYRLPRMNIWHCDLYRIADPAELGELGLEEDSSSRLTVIEWPDRLDDDGPTDLLELRLSDAAVQGAESPHEQATGLRDIVLVGKGRWTRRIDRLAEVTDFLTATSWAMCRLRHLQGDASRRSYARLACQAKQALLMDSPAMPDGEPVRDGKPYSRIAHLAENVTPFAAVANALHEQGFSTPRIIAGDLERGLLLLEDFGDRVFGNELAGGRPVGELYQHAVELLARLRCIPAPVEVSTQVAAPGGRSVRLSHAIPAYDEDALRIETELLVDWYLPHLPDAPSGDRLAEAKALYDAAWRPHLHWLAGFTGNWVLRDFHSPNLIWLPDREGDARVGLIDFQDAVRGHAAYDLVSLLQDARVDVSAEAESELFAHYCRIASDDPTFDEASFSRAYALLGAQRNMKIIGIFKRLEIRDGKPDYLRHLPRLWTYLSRSLAHPQLAALASWVDTWLPGNRRS